jgi:hypothetical protein
MTDVVKIAKERLDTLEAQIGELEEFIHMAEALLNSSLSNSDIASATDNDKPAESPGASKVSSFSTATDGNDSEADREDMSVLELKAGEQVRDSFTTHNEPSPDRRYPSMGRFRP